MESLHICYWETVGASHPIAVGSSPVSGASNARAARWKFHRQNPARAGVKLRVYKVVCRG